MGWITSVLLFVAFTFSCTLGGKDQHSGLTGDSASHSESDCDTCDSDDLIETSDSDSASASDWDHDGVSETDGDCDDDNPDVHPGAPEASGDGVDSDCDGLDATASPLQGPEYAVAGREGAYVGRSVAVAGDLDGDDEVDVLIGAPYTYGESDEGIAYVAHGPLHLGEMDLSTATPYTGLPVDASSLVGWAVAGPGDLDGDGLADMAYSVPFARGVEEFYAGVVYVIPGPALVPNEREAPDATILGAARYGDLGMALAAAGDANGDGLADLLVGSPRENTYEDWGGPEPGRTFLFAGPIEGSNVEEDAWLTLIGRDVLDYAGSDVASGDFNGDGHSDILIGGYGSARGAEMGGAAWVVYGPLSGTVSLDAAGAELISSQAGAYAGGEVACAQDVDADGRDDLLVGAPLSDASGERSGRAYLRYGPVTGSSDLEDADAVFSAVGAYDWTGAALAGAGDVNGDGYADVAIGAPQQYDLVTGQDARVSLFYGPLSGPRAPESADRIWVTTSSLDSAGMVLSTGVDLTGDGLPESLVGAPYDDQAQPQSGRVYALSLAD